MNRIKNLFIVFLYLLSFTTAYGREEKNDYELIWKEDFKGKSINYELIWKEDFKGKSINFEKWSKITRGKADWRKYIYNNCLPRIFSVSDLLQ